MIEYGDGDGDDGHGGSTRTTHTTVVTTRTKDFIASTHCYSYDGEEDIESGPSRITIDDLERMDRKEQLGQGYSTSTSKRSQEGRIERYSVPTRRRRRIQTIIATASLALIPTTLAAPPPYRHDISTRSPSSSRSQQQQRLLPRQTESTPPPKPSTTPFPSPSPSTSFSFSSSGAETQTISTQSQPSIDEGSIQYGIKYLTSMSTPTQALPTDVYVVDEQRLPFYLTQNENGEWVKVDNAWLLYGRQGGVSRSRILAIPRGSRILTQGRTCRRQTLDRMTILVRRRSPPRPQVGPRGLPSLIISLQGTFDPSYTSVGRVLIKQVGNRSNSIRFLPDATHRRHECHSRSDDCSWDHLVRTLSPSLHSIRHI